MGTLVATTYQWRRRACRKADNPSIINKTATVNTANNWTQSIKPYAISSFSLRPTVICYVLFNTRLSLFNKISRQSYKHTTRHSAKTQHRGVIFNYKHRRCYNKQKLQPGKCLTGQNKIKNKNKNKNDLWFLNKAGRRVGRRQPVAKVYNYIERYYLSRIVYDDRVRLQFAHYSHSLELSSTIEPQFEPQLLWCRKLPLLYNICFISALEF